MNVFRKILVKRGIDVLEADDGTRAIADEVNPVRVDTELGGVRTHVTHRGTDILHPAVDRTREIHAVDMELVVRTRKGHAQAVLDGGRHVTAGRERVAIINGMLVEVVLRTGNHRAAMRNDYRRSGRFRIALGRIQVHFQVLILDLVLFRIEVRHRRIARELRVEQERLGDLVVRTQMRYIFRKADIAFYIDVKKSVLVSFCSHGKADQNRKN